MSNFGNVWVWTMHAEPSRTNTWVKMSERKPEHGQEVYYFFNIVGVHRGFYELQELQEEIFGPGYMVDVFLQKDGFGFLTDDVTHWMDIDDCSVFPPDEPILN